MGTQILPAPAVIYTRRSTDRQESSLGEQLTWARRAAELHRLGAAGEFSDDAVSGSEIGLRDGLQDLIRFVESRTTGDPIRVVVTWSNDRLSRSDTLETFEVLSRLRRAGVQTILTNARSYDLHDPTDRTLLAVEQDFTSRGYVRRLSENTTRALLTRAGEGRWLGRVPYGFVIGPAGKLVPGEPVRADAVRWLFTTYATTGATLRDLAKAIQARGVPGPLTPDPTAPKQNAGRKNAGANPHWSRYAIYCILRNIAYIGTYRWNTQSSGRHCRVTGREVAEVKGRKDNRRTRNAPADVVDIQDAHPALVDPATFKAVAVRLTKNRGRRTTPNNSHVWPLSGLAHCGNCGSRMVGRMDRRTCNGRTYSYQILYCNRASEKGKGQCRLNRVLQTKVLAEAAELIREQFAQPGVLTSLRAEIEAVALEQSATSRGDVERLRTRLGEMDARLDQGTTNLLLCPAGARPRAAAKLAEWEAERTALATELANIQTAADRDEGIAASVADALAAMNRLGETVTEGDPVAVRDLFARVAEGVTLHFKYGQQLKHGRRRTYLASLSVDLLPEISHLLGKGWRTHR
jgi:DNA invertase Pin-like site-specific DNA recombinase